MTYISKLRSHVTDFVQLQEVLRRKSSNKKAELKFKKMSANWNKSISGEPYSYQLNGVFLQRLRIRKPRDTASYPRRHLTLQLP